MGVAVAGSHDVYVFACGSSVDVVVVGGGAHYGHCGEGGCCCC